MRRLSLGLILLGSLANAASPVVGRWDITVTSGNETYPDWLEVTMKDGAAQARVQPRSGSVHPAADVKLDGSHLTMTMTPANDKRPAITWDVTVANGKLTGTQKRGGETMAQLEGVRAPELKRPMPKAWAASEAIFNAKDLTGWEPFGPGENHWSAQNGELVDTAHGANLKTTRTFNDFKLHIELNCPDGGNSGIYLRGRYEIQVAYEKEPDLYHSMAAIYGMLAPSEEMPRKPGQWESFDVTLVGRTITLVRDGKTILDRQEIAGITGGALDANEAEPGPFYLQGDHTGNMKYRNITVAVPKS